MTKHTEVEFRLKATKSAKDFTAKIGAKLPKGVTPDGLPSELTQKIPQLADYGYAKMKDQILMVNRLFNVDPLRGATLPSYNQYAT